VSGLHKSTEWATNLRISPAKRRRGLPTRAFSGNVPRLALPSVAVFVWDAHAPKCAVRAAKIRNATSPGV
jgi:hypothetical protein